MTKVVTSVLVDSRDREPTSSSTSDFVVKLQNPLTNVVSVDLRQLIISEGIYNIDDFNGLFLLQAVWSPPSLPAVTLNLTAGYVPVGYYTLSQFAEALQTAIAQTFVAGGVPLPAVPWITCSVNAQRKLELYGVDNNLVFTISFPNGNALKTFGFNNISGTTSSTIVDTDGNPYQWIQAPFVLGLETIEYLCLRSAELGNRVQTARGLPAYDIIPIPDRIKPLVYTRYEAERKSTFNKQTLNELRIALVKPTGEVVDLRSNDVALVLEVVQEL